jgi:hypothetical protein
MFGDSFDNGCVGQKQNVFSRNRANGVQMNGLEYGRMMARIIIME